jgi:hypothetical protein
VPTLTDGGRPQRIDLGNLRRIGGQPQQRREDCMTNQQAFVLICGLVAVLHAPRLALRWQVKINQREIPMGLSVGGLLVAAGLCFWAFWLFL